MSILIEYLSMALLGVGAFFLTLGSVGIIKMPDFYRRLHAVSMSDTLGIILMTSGMILKAGLSLMALKLLTIFLLMAITNPVGSHALSRAALRSGLKPWNTPVKNERKSTK
ncbi:MAG: monovalent cation/H(+) antiporter subunit G [Puniceicoccaceae bacterium]